MKAITFPQFNRDLGAGDNPNTVNLPIAISLHPDPIYRPSEQAPKGVAFCISRWKLSPEELARIAERGEVWLGVMCPPDRPTQPPVFLTVNNPFTEEGYEAIPAEELL